MEFFSKTFKRERTQAEYSPIPNDAPPRIEHEDPKQRFGHSLSITRHERTDDFNAAIDHFYAMDIADIKEADLRPLLHGCMGHGQTAALGEILPLYEGLAEKTLRLEGSIDERGWKAFAEALEKSSLSVNSLALWNSQLDCSRGKWFLKALACMSELHHLDLGRVGAESIFLLSDFSRLECAPLKLQSIKVSAGSTDDIDVFPLLLKLLDSCKLRNVSLVDEGEVTTTQHEMLGKALQAQVQLESLRFSCHVPKNFVDCYMPFLAMKTSLKVLEVRHCDVGTARCNKLLQLLPRSKAELQFLSLTHCNLEPCKGADGGLQTSHLADLPDLLELDLGDNPLTDDAIVPLLLTLEKAKNTKLQRLNLNNTRMGDKTAEAMGSLLRKNSTLLSLGFASNSRRDDFFLKPLVLAMEHNTSLLQVEVSAFTIGAWRDDLRGHLARNREAFKKAVAEGMWHGMSVLLGSSFYPDLVDRIIDMAEFSNKDARMLSSLHPRAWAERHKALQTPDAST